MREIRLEFDPAELRGRDPRGKLSSASFCGNYLFTAGDDGAYLERFTLGKRNELSGHRSFRLRDYLSLPGGAGDELDLEGLAVADGYLWVMGAHSRQRKKPAKEFTSEGEVFRALRSVELTPSHFLLGRIPLAEAEDGSPIPVRENGARRDARFGLNPGGDELRALLARDPHLGPFARLPGKENGLDFEGLAVHEGRLFIGCRGPVLRGWACVLEIRVEDHAGGLRLRKIRGRPYRKHFLYCDGLGVRELEFRGEDLLLIAGPTMLLDGPLHVYRWKEAARLNRDSAQRREALDHLFEIPRLRGKAAGKDRAEGLATLPGGKSLLVIYDNAAKARRPGKTRYVASAVPYRPGRGREPDATP
jgi:hypothetical protein